MDPNEKRSNPSKAHRSQYKRNSVSKTPEDARQKRLALEQQLRKKHREQLITTKRFRTFDVANITGDEGESEYDLSQQEVEKLCSDLKNVDHEVRVQTLKQLAEYLIDPPDALKDFVIKGDCVEIFLQFLSGTDPEEQLHTTWCITNIAGGLTEMCEKVLPTVPYLIGYLDGQNMALQDQAAWAIGNIAAEADIFRELLRANGALVPLIRLLDSTDTNLVHTVCFALSNLARGPDARIHELFASGIAPKLLKHLAADEMKEIVSEICWVLTYLTSGNEAFSTELLKEGLAPLLVRHMTALTKSGPLALPLVRTLGNIASGPDEHTDVLLEQPGFLAGMLEYVQSECRSVKKESLWVMSNITADHKPQALTQVIHAGFIPILASIATHQNFDLRKEAAFSLVHIASHGEQYMRILPHQELLPGVLDFVRSQDTQLIRLGLTYLQMLLTQVPEGKPLMESVPNAIDALESITLTEDEELRRTASALMDRYFGEDIEGPGRVESAVGAEDRALAV